MKAEGNNKPFFRAYKLQVNEGESLSIDICRQQRRLGIFALGALLHVA